MPLDVVGQHAEEDVGADSIAQTVMDGADLEIDRLHRAKGALDLRQGFVMAHTTRAIQALWADRGADDINAIEGRLRGNGVLLAGEGERRVGDGEGEVLGHLEEFRMDKLLNVAEVAKVLGITTKAVYSRLQRGVSPCRHPCLSPARHVCVGGSPMSRSGLRLCLLGRSRSPNRAGIRTRRAP